MPAFRTIKTRNQQEKSSPSDKGNPGEILERKVLEEDCLNWQVVNKKQISWWSRFGGSLLCRFEKPELLVFQERGSTMKVRLSSAYLLTFLAVSIAGTGCSIQEVFSGSQSTDKQEYNDACSLIEWTVPLLNSP